MGGGLVGFGFMAQIEKAKYYRMNFKTMHGTEFLILHEEKRKNLFNLCLLYEVTVMLLHIYIYI